MSAMPKTVSSLAISFGGLAVFLIFASCLLVSYPFATTNFFGIDNKSVVVQSPTPPQQDVVGAGDGAGAVQPVSPKVEEKEEVVPSSSGDVTDSTNNENNGSNSGDSGDSKDSTTNNATDGYSSGDSKHSTTETASNSGNSKDSATRSDTSDSNSADSKDSATNNESNVTNSGDTKDSATNNETADSNSGDSKDSTINNESNVSNSGDSKDSTTNNETDGSNSGDSNDSIHGSNSGDSSDSKLDNDNEINGSNFSDTSGPKVDNETFLNSTLETFLPSSKAPANTGKVDSGSCDLYQGKWTHDPSGPLYTNNSCPVITQMQNCQGNGRPDKDYENWRWKPSQCDLPRFDAKKFLELMRGKTLAFIGDSVARNQMESMICILWQVEIPKNRGNRRMQRWYFRSTDTFIVRIWSSWLVRTTSEPFDFAPEGVTKLHLDAPDEGFLDLIPKFDVIVLSSGHWFAKQSVYILNNEIVGGQLWWPGQSRPQKINNIEAFGVSVETILTSLGTHPNYTGLTIVRSFSPDHYEGGAWNTGGSCTGKERPALEEELVPNGFTDIMHEKQMTGYNKATKKMTNQSKLRMMDITKAFGYRHDGHPGPYRSPDPNKITKRGPNGQPPPQDCLHWCMPGPVDTWNELVLEIIRREYEGTATYPA